MAYIEIGDLRDELGITGQDEDFLLSTAIGDAQSAIERHTNRRFEVTTDTTRYFTYGRDTDGRTLYLDEDLCSITTVTNGDGAVIAAGSYVVIPRNRPPWHEIKLKNSANLFWTYEEDYEDAISITGKWGWSETPTDDIKRVCKRLAVFFYRSKDSQVFDMTAFTEGGTARINRRIPSDVIEMLAPYVKVIT